MNENNNTPDKITIKVRHWDEDYHDITIDWSNESFDYKKQVHHQLSAYTGIPVGYQYGIDFQNTAPLRSIHFYNAEFLDQERRGLTWHQWNTKESAMNTLQDGDCFLFKTRLLWGDYPSIYCSYELLHRDLVNETGCNLYYCQHLGSRFFTNKFSQLIKYEQLQTLLDAARFPLTGESFTRARLNVNVEHLARLKCSAVLQEYPDLVRLRNYYLRYRG